MIRKLLRNLDLFGSQFYFYSGKKRKKQTALGGILTLLLILIFIALSYIFGINFFLRTNPTITISTENDFKYEIIDTEKDSIFFAFRIEDYDGNFVNTSNTLYMKIYYYTSEEDNHGKYRANIKDEFLTFHICNDSDYREYNLSKHYGILYCPDLGGRKFGGYWDSPNLYYFEIQVFFCENGNPYSKNSTCTSIEELKKFLHQDNPKFFALYYQVIQFNPLSRKHPLMKIYKNLYYCLSYKLQRNDDIFLKKYIINDDQGWLFSSNKNLSEWGVDVIRSTYSFYNDSDLSTEGASSKIFEINLYTSMEKNYYTRYYMKVQNVIANMGSIINIIIIIFNIISQYIGEKIRKFEIIYNYFEFEEKKRNKKFVFKSNTEMRKHIKIQEIKNEEENENENENNKNKIEEKSFINLNKSEISLKENIPKFIKSSKFKLTFSDEMTNDNILFKKKNLQNKSQDRTFIEQSGSHLLQKLNTQPIISTNFGSSNKSSIMKYSIKFKKRNIKIDLSFFCCPNKNKPSDTRILYWFFINLVEVNRYLRVIKEIEFLKKLLLNKNQINSLFYLKKINLNNLEERKALFEHYDFVNSENNIISYYKSLLNSINNSKIDKMIYENLSDRIKNKILS